MKKFLFLGIAVCLCGLLNAQKVYFMYFQSEAAAPFYLKMAGRVHSSTSQGYLILSMLKDSTYSFQIGQPGIKQDEPRYSVTINKADKGFLLKNTDGKINLYDLQTLSVYKPLPDEFNSENFIKKTDKFSVLLAQAADDMSIMYEAVAVSNENARPRQETSGKTSVTPVFVNVNAEAAQPVSDQIETAGGPGSNAAQKSVMINDKGSEQMNIHEEFVKSIVIKRSESSTSEGFGLVFLDNNNGVVDTVRLLIPNQKFIFSNENKQPSVSNRPSVETSNEQDAATPAKADVSGTENATEKDIVTVRNRTAKDHKEQATEDVPASDKKGS